MKKRPLSRVLVMLLVTILIACAVPMNVVAATIYDESKGGSEYYNVISEKSWELAPGIKETELVLNNDAGTRRQVLHTATVDLNNPYTKVISGYKGMWPKEGKYGTESTSVQALNAEKLGYGNVVVATNTTLSWYTTKYYKDNPHVIGEPLGYTILNGEMYYNSSWTYNEETKTFKKHAADSTQTVIVINYDEHPLTGEARPEDIPKVWIRSSTDPLTGWEEQAIPVSFGFLVKPDANGNPVNQYKNEDHGEGIASRTFVGVRADGTLVLAVSDGEQAPYSTGFTNYEMADYMIKMGCIIAANCDGGGSTTFCSQRPGEDFKVNCSLADGGERPTTSTILVISTAPADGVFARATVESEYDYYTPGSTVEFSVLGTDAVGTKVDIPDDIEWKIKEEGMGTIKNGVFTSNGTEGIVTAQIIYDGKPVGEKSITIATPDSIDFQQPVVTIPFGKTAKIPVVATANIDGVNHEIGLGPNDVTFTTTNDALGSFNGLNFVAVDEANAPADITSTVTATLNMGTKPSATVLLNLGKASEVLWDFEGGQADIDVWNVINNRKNKEHWDYYLNLSLADRSNGQVHDGNYSMRLETNGLSSVLSHSDQYAWIRLGVDGDPVVLRNARSVGFWLYVPEDNIQCWVKGYYMIDTNGDGVADTGSEVNMMDAENVYYNIDESGWHYLSMDVSAFEEIVLKDTKKYDKDPSDGMEGETGEFFMAIVFHKASNNKLWQENGTINGPFTYYLDNFTVDYSEAVDDRENPVFDKIYLDGTTALVKRDVITTTSNVLNLSAAVADASTKIDADKNVVPIYNASGLNPSSAKVYIDGVEVNSVFANGKLSANGIAVADGYHRVKFEICDNAGNKSVVIRVVKVESGVEASTLELVPADATLDRIPFGSIYWMNLKANEIETIQSVSTVIDLNSVNHWQLDNMELAEGFTAEYSIAEETNTATITITRTGDNIQEGEAILAKIPVRIIYFDTDINTKGYTAKTYWTNYSFFPQDLKMDVDMGLITHVDGKTSTFSNEEFHVDTEMYTSMPNMDKIYWEEHGTTHVHTAVVLTDKAPTCTENGYTDRTFCEGCNSVVEWGTTVPATGHTYQADVANKKLVCACGREFTGTGLQIISGKSYYTVNGELTSGWLTIDDEWYYFDKKTYASVPTYYNGYVTYKFEADGKLVSGEWYRSDAGIRYYEGPSYIRGGKHVMTWYEIDGNDYCIDKYGYVATGTRWVNDDNTGDIYTWYTFDENGVCQGRWKHNGLAEWNGNIYYLKDGVSQYGMYLVDGDYYYFYFSNYYRGMMNESFYCQYNKGLLPNGTYQFGYDGKMVNNDVYNVDGVLYYYVKGQVSQGTGTFTYNGSDYVIETNGKVLFTGMIKDASGKFQYYENGVQIGEHIWDTGTVSTESTCSTTGVITYTCNECGESKSAAIPMIAHIDEDENYACDKCGTTIEHEHVWDTGVISKPATCIVEGLRTYTCQCEETKTETIAAPGHIDENGNSSCDVCGETVSVKNGLVFDSDGNIRYYVNGVATRAGLVQDSEGNYYYINSTLKAVKNCTYAFNDSMSNGLLPAGKYQFGTDGKMINPPAGEKPHQHVWGDGEITTEATCTENGIRTYICECGLSKTEPIASTGHADEDENFSCDTCGAPIDHVHVWGEGEVTTPATCTEDGVKTYTCKCGETKTEAVESTGHVDEDENFSCDTCGAPIDHVHVWGEGEIITPATCTEDGIKTYTCKCGETKTEAVESTGHVDEDENLSCDICGTPIEHTHVWGKGKVTTPANCGEDGIMTYTCKCGETKTEPIVATGNHIDENGNLSCDVCNGTLKAKNGLVFDKDGNIRYYVNGVATRAGLVQDSEGNYYYVNSTLKAVKNCTYAFSTAMGNGLLPGGTYQFGVDGKMINPPVVECAHTWGEWEVTTPATETSTGVETRSCGVCGKTETREIPKLELPGTECTHEWGEWKVTTPATETSTGVESRSCGVCGETETREIPKLEPPVTECTHIDEDGNLFCDVCNGVLSAKNGLVFDKDGNIRYYVNGVATRAGLVQDSKGNYYYVNSTLKAVKNCTYAFSTAMGNGLLPGGKYQFDAEGRLILNA